MGYIIYGRLLVSFVSLIALSEACKMRTMAMNFVPICRHTGGTSPFSFKLMHTRERGVGHEVSTFGVVGGLKI